VAVPRIAVLIFPVAIVAIGFAGIFVRLAQPAPPVVIGFYRMFFAAGLLSLWIALRRPRLRLRGRAAWLAFAAGACFGGDMAFWQTSILLTSVATATLLVNLTPVHVGVYARFVRGERLHRRFVAGAALALLGTVVLMGEPARGPDDLRGMLLAIAASLLYAAYIVVMREARREIDVFSGLYAMTAGAALVLLLTALAKGDPLTGFPSHSWAVMALAAVVSQLVGVFGIVWALRYLPDTLASVGLLGQPISAALLAWWILDEPVGTLQALGGAAVLAGIGLASRARSEPAPQPMPSNGRGFHQGK
jgi:drug/metabolite transporter (DMT)-like permease